MGRLDNYAPVKDRKQQFYVAHPDGRIIVDAIKVDEKSSFYKATLFKNAQELKENLPLATGYAQEFKGMGSPANKTSWAENCEESAIGRALDNAGFAKDNRCSREEMVIAEKHEKLALKNEDLVNEIRGLCTDICEDNTIAEKKEFMETTLRIKDFSEVYDFEYKELLELHSVLLKMMA